MSEESISVAEAPRKLSPEAARREQRLYWLSKSMAERLAAATELTKRLYRMKGIDLDERKADFTPRRVRRHASQMACEVCVMSDEQATKLGPAKEKPISPEGKEDGKNKTKVASETPENAIGQLNPSSPGDTGTTPGTNADIG